MEYFTVEGLWWVPDEGQRRVAGTLTFDAEGLELVLYDALREFGIPADEVVGVAAPEWEVKPFVHGMTRDGRRFTLFDVGGANLTGPFDVVEERYRPELALEGCHTSSNYFAEVWCGFDYLDAWAEPPSVTQDSDARDTVEVRMSAVEFTRAELNDTSLRLISGVEGESGDARVDLVRWTAFRVTPAAALALAEFLSGYVRALQDLLVFCVGRPVRLTSLRVLPTDLPDARQGTAAAFFNVVQPASSKTPTDADVTGYMAPTILLLQQAPISAEDLLNRWFALWETHREVLTLLLAPLYAPFIYGEHGFASTFQSAEALHDVLLPTRDVDRADHRQRLEVVVTALEAAEVDAGVVEWASNVLRSRNDKPLWRKIDDLVRSTGLVGDAVLNADPKFGSVTAAARTGVSHGGAGRPLNATARYWYAQTLRWIVRARLLMELFDDPEDAQRRVLRKTPFQRCMKEIASV